MNTSSVPAKPQKPCIVDTARKVSEGVSAATAELRGILNLLNLQNQMNCQSEPKKSPESLTEELSSMHYKMEELLALISEIKRELVG